MCQVFAVVDKIEVLEFISKGGQMHTKGQSDEGSYRECPTLKKLSNIPKMCAIITEDILLDMLFFF